MTRLKLSTQISTSSLIESLNVLIKKIMKQTNIDTKKKKNYTSVKKSLTQKTQNRFIFPLQITVIIQQ